jgi:membrane-associated phospholipid phosphatase
MIENRDQHPLSSTPPRPSRRWQVIGLFMVGSLLGLLVNSGILLVLIKWHDELSEAWLVTVDQMVQERLHQMASPVLTQIMLAFTTLGDILGLLIVALCCSLGLLLWKRWYAAGSLLIAIGGAVVLNQVAKWIFHRPRPTVAWALVQEDGFSFPSGHAMMSLVFYGMMAYLLFHLLHRFPWRRIIVVVVMLLLVGGIGLSRIYLGAHYPSDIVARFLASGIWLVTVIGVTEMARRFSRFTPVPSRGGKARIPFS